MQIQTDSCCGLISKGRLSDFKTLRMGKCYVSCDQWQGGGATKLALSEVEWGRAERFAWLEEQTKATRIGWEWS
jgi:hypothetical protein